MGGGVKLNLGACDRALPDYRSVDIAPPADEIADLTKAWPWPDSSIEAVYAHDVFEHLPDKRHTMNELYRVLEPGGTADVCVPTIRGVGACCDPTHLSLWSAGDFEYYERGNYARERFRNSPYYGINADFSIAGFEHVHYVNKFDETVWKFRVHLKAEK